MTTIALTEEAIAKAFKDSNIEYFESIFDILGIKKDETPLLFGEMPKRIVGDLLTLAASVALTNSLDDKMMFFLIERIGRLTKIFNIAQFVIGYTLPEQEKDYGAIPQSLKNSFLKNRYSKKAAKEISTLNTDVLKSALSFLCNNDEITKIDRDFHVAILKKIDSLKLVPRSTLLLIIANNLTTFSITEPLDELDRFLIRTGIMATRREPSKKADPSFTQ